MADATNIEWMLAVARSRGMRAAVWNPIRGCRPASEGCKHCWAATVANMRQHNPHPATRSRYDGLTTKTADGRPVFNGTTRLIEMDLDLPLRTRKPTAYFVCSEADLFGEAVEDEWIDRVFAVMALRPQHLFICLTKRAARMRTYAETRLKTGIALGQAAADLAHVARPNSPLRQLLDRGFLSNVWLGVSVETQAAADERIPDLLATPAALRWISAEPLLGPINLTRIAYGEDAFEDCGGHPLSGDGVVATGYWWDATTGNMWSNHRHTDGSQSGLELVSRGPAIGWTVCGGESGHGARPAHPDWFRSLRDQCAAAGVPYFFKQHGEHSPDALVPGFSNLRHVWPDGRHCAYGDLGKDGFANEAGRVTVARVGKKAAGHLLDDVEHLAVPEVER